ncbi:MAG: hypothetical protein QM784_37950 [Polyangiaceae bacterium]
MRSMVVAIATGSVALFLGAGALYLKHEQRTAREVDALKEEVARLRETQVTEASDTARLKQLASLVAHARSTDEAHPSAASAKTAGHGTEAQGAEDPDAPSTASISVEQSRQFVNSAYDEEAPDPNWSPSASRQLEALVQRSLPSRGALRSVACRSTLCRIEVSLDSAEELSKFGFVAFRDWPGSIFLANESQDRNGLQATYYASREGTEPPLNGGP